jgi:hypothetical protein
VVCSVLLKSMLVPLSQIRAPYILDIHMFLFVFFSSEEIFIHSIRGLPFCRWN